MAKIIGINAHYNTDFTSVIYVYYESGKIVSYWNVKNIPKTAAKFMLDSDIEKRETNGNVLVKYRIKDTENETETAEPTTETTAEPEPVCTACDFCVHYDCCKSNAPDCIVCRAGEDARENCDLSCRSCFTPYDVSESEPEPEPETASEECELCSECTHYHDCKAERIVRRQSSDCFYISPCPDSGCCGCFARDEPETAEPEIPDRFEDITFADDEHKQAFFEVIVHMNLSSRIDLYRESLAYLITLDKVCRQHIDDLYDFEERFIRPTALEKGWQTSTSLRTTLLAFNLFNSGTGWCPEELKDYCTPSCIFGCSYSPYYWEAVKILYPQYTSKVKINEYRLRPLHLQNL